jgi:hypothetical protein
VFGAAALNLAQIAAILIYVWPKDGNFAHCADGNVHFEEKFGLIRPLRKRY